MKTEVLNFWYIRIRKKFQPENQNLVAEEILFALYVCVCMVVAIISFLMFTLQYGSVRNVVLMRKNKFIKNLILNKVNPLLMMMTMMMICR